MCDDHIFLVDESNDPEEAVFAAPLDTNGHPGLWVVRECNGEVVVSRERLREWALRIVEATDD